MKLDKTARAVLGITALAWSIPFAQAVETRQPGGVQLQANSAEFVKLDSNGYLEFKEIAHIVASSVEGVEDVKDGIAIRR